VSGELSRRSFLSGVAKAAGAALVVEATLEDVKAFAGAGGRVSVLAPERQPFIASGHAMPWPVQPGETLYNERGRPVAIVQHVEMARLPYDVTTADDRWKRHMIGGMRFTLTAVSTSLAGEQ
jgi:hypothetical protein